MHLMQLFSQSKSRWNIRAKGQLKKGPMGPWKDDEDAVPEKRASQRGGMPENYCNVHMLRNQTGSKKRSESFGISECLAETQLWSVLEDGKKKKTSIVFGIREF